MRVKSSVLGVSVAVAAAILPAHGGAGPGGYGGLARAGVKLSASTQEYEPMGLIRDAQNEVGRISSAVVYLSSRLDAMNGAAGHDEAVKALGRLAGRNNAVGKRLGEITAAVADGRSRLSHYGDSLRGLPQVTRELRQELADLQALVGRLESGAANRSEPETETETKYESFGSAAPASPPPAGEAGSVLTDAQRKALEAVAGYVIATAKPDIPPGPETVSAGEPPEPAGKFALPAPPGNANQRLTPGVFENHPLPARGAALAQMKLAVIDASNGSKAWLRHHRPYLEQEGIPVMVIDTDDTAFTALHQEFFQAGEAGKSGWPASQGVAADVIPKGQLIVGREPEAGRGLIHSVLWQMGVRHFPVVIEDGVAWQESPAPR